VGLAARDTIEAAAAAVDAAGRLSGTSSIRTGSLHEKLRRDLDTMRRHTMFDANRSAPLGRQVAGIPTVAFPFLLPD
jgi:hypothetical protein